MIMPARSCLQDHMSIGIPYDGATMFFRLWPCMLALSHAAMVAPALRRPSVRRTPPPRGAEGEKDDAAAAATGFFENVVRKATGNEGALQSHTRRTVRSPSVHE